MLWPSVLGVWLQVAIPYVPSPVQPIPADVIAAAVGGQAGGRDPVERSERWTSRAFFGGDITALAVDPMDHEIVYAGTKTARILRSADGGTSWEPSTAGLAPTGWILSIVVDPGGSGVVYSTQANLLTTEGSIRKSVDGGANWTVARFERDVGTLAFGPGSPAALYVATGEGVLKSGDGGVSWTNLGLIQARAVAVDPTSGNRLYAAALSAAGESTVFTSGDGGATWFPTSLSLYPGIIRALRVHPTDGSRVFAGTSVGLFRSLDGGSTWTELTVGLGLGASVSGIEVDSSPVLFASLYAGTNGPGVFKSLDGGEIWSQASAGLPLEPTWALARDPRAEDTLYAGFDPAGVFKSTDAAGHWVPSSGGIAASSAGSIAVDPTNPRVAYATASAPSVTRDGGRSWSVIDGAPIRPGGPIAVARSNGRALYAASSPGSAFTQVIRSTDGGFSWSSTFPTILAPTSLAVDPRFASTVYMADGWVLKSGDGGETWYVIRSGLEFGVHLVAVDPFDGAVLYAVRQGDPVLYRSRDAGNEWAPAGSVAGADEIGAIASDPLNEGVLFAAAAHRIYRSSDRGDTFAPTGFEGEATVLLVDPSRPGVLYAGTPDRGVFRSADSGTTWGELNDGLQSLGIHSLAIDPLGRVLYAGTDAGAAALEWTPIPRQVPERSSLDAPTFPLRP